MSCHCDFPKSQEELKKKIAFLESTQMMLLKEKEERENELMFLKEQVAEMKLTISKDISPLTKQLSDLHIRQQLLENTSFDGKLVWKIDNVTTRIRQAVSGHVTALHSAPAFTQRYGYKFCARLYLNGDGLGKGTHISLFLVIMKSEYDSRLEWPFNRSVKFKLFNQEKRGPDLVEIFSPDQQSTSFRRPVKHMNVASGCPKFIRISSFINDGFLKDDCVFFEIVIGEVVLFRNILSCKTASESLLLV